MKLNAKLPDFFITLTRTDSGVHPPHQPFYFRRLKIKPMKITKITSYRDGGTIEITTEDNKIYCIDDRIGTDTRGTVYEGYPDNSKPVENQEDIKLQIANAVMLYYTDNKEEQFSYQKGIVKLLKYINPKDKAKELILFYDKIVYPFMGSGMLVNMEDEDVILRNAKICAHKTVDEILLTGPHREHEAFDIINGVEYWVRVKNEITKYENKK